MSTPPPNDETQNPDASETAGAAEPAAAEPTAPHAQPHSHPQPPMGPPPPPPGYPFAPVVRAPRAPWINPARRGVVAGTGIAAVIVALGVGFGVGWAVGDDGGREGHRIERGHFPHRGQLGPPGRLQLPPGHFPLGPGNPAPTPSSS